MHRNVEKILVTKEEIEKRVTELGKEISRDYAGEKLLLVGILKGSVLFMADLMRHLDLDVEIDFMAVSSYGSGTQTSGEIKIRKDLGVDIAQRRVLVVEDIVDTGTTLYYLRKMLQERGAASVDIVTLLSKPSRRQMDVEVKYTGFTVPDEFVVGYGLDFAESYRQLPIVGVLRPECYAVD